MIFIRHPFTCNFKYLEFDSTPVSEDAVRKAIVSSTGYSEFSLIYNGKKLQDSEVVPDNSTVHVTLSLPGGKGGFGSMLRAIGAQIEKTTNREACRDLSGRRLRDINEEQRLKKWISKEAEREAEKIKRRKARIERLKSKPAHKFFNFEYEKEISELPDRINDALSEGLQKAKPVKRPSEEPGTSKPPKKTWLTDDFSASSSDSDSETNTTKNESPPKKIKMHNYDSEVSDLSQPGPSSCKDNSYSDSEESLTDNSNSVITDMKEDNDTITENMSIDSVEVDIQSDNTKDKDSHDEREKPKDILSIVEEKNVECNIHEVISEVKESELKLNVEIKETEDIVPINLMDFQNTSDFENLGLDKLKSELMLRGLKCGGTLSDRAQRLWKVRGLQPSEYPANLLAKNKK